MARGDGHEIGRKGKRKRILKRLIVISLAAVCIGIFLCRQSYTVEQAIEKGATGNEMLQCEQIIYQEDLEEGKVLVVYGNPQGQICSAVIKKNMIFYETEHMVGGMTAGSRREKVEMESVSYAPLKFYLIGVITDDAVDSVVYGEDHAMTEIEYQGIRGVVETDEGINPNYFSRGYQVLDKDGTVLESEPRRWEY